MSAEKTVFGDKYKKEARLGKGTYGEVWKCCDLSLDRLVAVKFLHGGVKDFGKLTVEGKALSALTHKNIVVVHDLGADDKDCWLVMELVDSHQMLAISQGVVKQKTWLPFDQARDIMQQILEGLESAHDKSRVHRRHKASKHFLA